MAAVAVPSHARVEPGSHTLEPGTLPTVTVTETIDHDKIASEWIGAFNECIASKNWSGVAKLFARASFWRDQLGLSWNFHTLTNPDKIEKFLNEHGSRIHSIEVDRSSEGRKPGLAPIDFHGNVKGVKTFINVDSDVGRGRGTLTLCLDPSESRWKAFILFTTLNELKGHEEFLKDRRPAGVEHGEHAGRRNWVDQRVLDKNYENGTEPTVFIVGAGQAGLTLGARLKNLGVNTLLIDKNDRVGDNWRKRYYSLVLHDPVWYDHLPYMEFPDFWPVFTPKDKLGDWFEQYVSSLELNVWTKTHLQSTHYDEAKKRWTITVDRTKPDGTKETRTLHPRFVVQATGHSGEKNFPSHITGLKNFEGHFLGHSSEFPGARPNSKGRKAVVVGCCNSGHDIAQAFYENGYDTTIVQRSSTYIMTSKEGLDVLLGGLYEENGPPLEDADTIFYSIPHAILKRLHVDATAEIARRDAPLLEGLEKAGFKVDMGPDEAGFFMKYFQRGGGYYIDVGCSQLIVDGKIKVKQGQELESVGAHGLKFADGSELEADEIVFATGYTNMRGTCRKIFGDEVADRVKDVWGFDDEGELRTMWRRTGLEGLWFMGGNLGLCRWYSRLLALQLKALEEGIMKYDDF